MSTVSTLQVTLSNYSVWRGAVVLLASAVVAAMLAWLGQANFSVNLSVWLVAGLSVSAALALAISLWRVPAAVLVWNGQAWQVRRLDADQAPASDGNLEVCLDLGPWLLLRFTPHHAAGKRAPRWLPVQRSAVGPHWHALRCALFSPQMTARRGSAADG